MIGWQNTRNALGKLEELLTCKIWWVHCVSCKKVCCCLSIVKILSTEDLSLFVVRNDNFIVSTYVFTFGLFLTLSANLVSNPSSLEVCDHIFCRYVTVSRSVLHSISHLVSYLVRSVRRRSANQSAVSQPLNQSVSQPLYSHSASH